MYRFNAELAHREIVEWIRDWFDKNGKNANAVIGMSGGKDSTIAAALCVEALGANRVIGVAMPDHGQGINDADKICEHLGMRYIVAPIGYACDGIKNISLVDNNVAVNGMWSEQTVQNIPPRIRMTMLYAIAQTYNGRPANTCNLSEDYVGYATLFGDSAGSFSPLGKLTVTEILALGDEMKLPYEWVHKVPDDGLPHSCADEEKFGFTYAELDGYIRQNIVPDGKVPTGELKIEKIQRMYVNNKFKTQIIQIPAYEPSWNVLNGMY